ncbi:MAG TPA: two-component regulator propeller domain-containing protein [Verrucomicrobiae bacterium]|nr:two-component regulator propeller domain-containing protein [Verrucomicrobiae bacterium]
MAVMAVASLAFPAWAGRSDADQYLIGHWLAADGIPENAALAVAQTPEGYIWVGSTGGLLRFNGKDFSHADDLYDYPPLGSVITLLSADRSGRLWAGTAGGEIYLLQRGAWGTLNVTNVPLRSVAEDNDGNVFVGTADGRVFQYDGARLKPLSAPPGMIESGVFCLRDEADGGIWMANRGVIAHWDGKAWEKVGIGVTGPFSVVAAVARGGGIWVYASGSMRHFRRGMAPEMMKAPVVNAPRQLLQDHAGHLWIASNVSGLTRLSLDGSVLTISDTNGLSHNSSWCVMEDFEGDLWLGTSSGGLHRLRERYFTSIGFEQGLPDRIARTVALDGPGRIIVGTHGGGLARIEHQKVVWTQPSAAAAHDVRVWSVLHDHAGTLWAGTFGRGLFIEETNGERTIPLPPAMARTINALMEDSRGRMWVGTIDGLGVVEQRKFRVPPEAAGLTNFSVQCFAEDPKTGAIWIGTYENGLFCLANQKLTSYGYQEGLPDLRVNALFFDKDGCLWIGFHTAGMARLRGGKISAIGRAQGLPASGVAAIVADDLGYFWIASDQGLIRVAEPELHRAADGGIGMFAVFNRGDGLDNPATREGDQPLAVRDETGRLWFATLNGVVTVDPRALRVNTNAPPVVIESVAFRDDDGAAHTILSPGETIVLPPGSSEVEVKCAALSFPAPEKIRYAYRLEGADRDWVDLGNRGDIYFRALSRGAFHLRVKAANNDGFWNEAGDTLQIVQQPFWWQTYWFRSVAALALMGLAGGVVWRVQQRKIGEQQRQWKIERAHAQEKAHLDEQLRQAQKMEAVGQLSGGIAHDFNNILSVIMGHVGLLQEENTLSAETRDSIAQIGQGAERAANLTRQLLAFGRRQVIRLEPLDLNLAVVSVVNMLQRILGEDIHVALSLQPGHLLVRADAGMLDQVLMNLAVNARDAMPQGGTLTIATSEKTVSAEEARTISEGAAGQFICLTVKDTGVGMSEEVKAHLFEPFFTTKEPGKGTGLGLATVFGIVKQHGGMVRVDSALRQGSALHVLLPVYHAPPA